ncbi:hypothetical protein AAGS61_14000 [Lysinibacillus sp. KU-BSD001]|uniref:hypothetical protein n=1 Tax=Lysinibacillus sp. KU-BSD001 TaxID=3141328 RepID=UPI0036E8873B
MGLTIRMDYAINLLRTAEYAEAKIVFNQLLKIYTSQAQTENSGLCLYQLATIAYMRGEMQQFQTLFTRYEKRIHETSQPQLQAHYSILRGLTQLADQNYEQAIQAFTNALPIAEQSKLADEKIIALLHIQKCHIALQHFEPSLEMSDTYWEKYADIITFAPVLHLYYMLNRAETLLALHRLKETNALLQKCEQQADLGSMPKEHIKTLVLRAYYYMEKKELNYAMDALQQALIVAKEIEDMQLLHELYEALVKNCEMRGKTKLALQFAKKQLQLQQELVKK